MGAWGVGPFDNDDALDLLYLIESDSRQVLIERLGKVVSKRHDESIDVDEAGAVIAATALVGARMSGLPVGDPLADEWLDANPTFEVDAELSDLALRGIRRVAANSELRDLMHEEGLVEAWDEANLTVMGRLLDEP